ncbi:MAG: leucine-rich repeat domain-containing protein, partial [Candidatus Symbiothrix sp.]|nr:leucine-rich repeat domain-containing protein [Candidatus Symbiothrix sp.]
IAMLLGTASIFAQRGRTGPLTWNLSKGTLTISGIGAMPDYNGNAPWDSYHSSITTVAIENL